VETTLRTRKRTMDLLRQLLVLSAYRHGDGLTISCNTNELAVEVSACQDWQAETLLDTLSLPPHLTREDVENGWVG